LTHDNQKKLQEYFVSGFNVILPTIVKDLDIPAVSYTWPANAFSLVVSSLLLAFGRLADMYGGYPVYVLGLAWLCVWSLIAGFSENQYMLDVCRALQGLGPAAFLPSGVMLMGSIYRPGPRKNLVFSIYGACAPLGFYTGIFFSGLTGQYTRWGWYFWTGTLLVLTTLVVAILTVPSDVQERKGLGVKMDWPGAVLIVSGLVLVVFAITDSSHAPDGWKSPYILVTFLLGAIILGVAVYVEGWVVEMPLLPAELFKVPRMKALVLALLLTYGSLGIFLFYATF
jgi:MFS family permease